MDHVGRFHVDLRFASLYCPFRYSPIFATSRNSDVGGELVLYLVNGVRIPYRDFLMLCGCQWQLDKAVLIDDIGVAVLRVIDTARHAVRGRCILHSSKKTH